MAIQREPYGFVHADGGGLKDVYGGPGGQVFVECMRIRPDSGASKAVILFSHPIGGGSFLPLVTALARAGRHVIYCNPRYRGNDTALILEKCLLDLGACIYDPACPAKPPYDDAFVARFREAQVARNRRITVWAKAELAALRAAGETDAERCFTVQGTMCDVRWTDPTQDPSDRPPNTCYLGEPRLVNDGPVGLARFTTLRSWLSQWSYDESRANGTLNAARISCPALVVSNTADLACTPSHAQRLFDAVAAKDKAIVQIKGADHYYAERRDLLPTAVGEIGGWLDARGL